MTATQLYRKMVDYLFLVWNEGFFLTTHTHTHTMMICTHDAHTLLCLAPVGAGNTSLCDICHNGFHQQQATIPADTTAPVLWLTNSVNIADHVHLAQQGQSKVGRSTLLLCKVFIGHAVETCNSSLWVDVCTHVLNTWFCLLARTSPCRESFPSADSVFRVCGPATQDNSTDLYSKDWFIFNPSLVLPEYIIHFNYLSPVRTWDCPMHFEHEHQPLQHFPENALEVYISSHSLPDDEEIAALAPAASLCPRLAMLDEPTLLELTGQPSLSCIQVG